MSKENDNVNHPKHYTEHPSGVECIQVTEHMNFCLGNAVKYIWRAGLKKDAIEDLKKAIWYCEREIKRISSGESDKIEEYKEKAREIKVTPYGNLVLSREIPPPKDGTVIVGLWPQGSSLFSMPPSAERIAFYNKEVGMWIPEGPYPSTTYDPISWRLLSTD
jgi:hypothetical protein